MKRANNIEVLPYSLRGSRESQGFLDHTLENQYFSWFSLELVRFSRKSLLSGPLAFSILKLKEGEKAVNFHLITQLLVFYHYGCLIVSQTSPENLCFAI